MLDHPFLVKLYWAFQTSHNLYFVMNFVSGGTLKDLIKKHKRFSQDAMVFYISEIILAIEYLHNNVIES